MLNLKSASAVFLFLVLTVNIAHFVFGLGFWFHAIPVSFLLLSTGLGSFFIRWNFYFKSLNRVDVPGSVVLTFDDGPHPGNTVEILRVLEAEGVQATFFCIGKNAEKYPQWVAAIADAGHTIGLHSYCHIPAYGFFPVKKLKTDHEKSVRILGGILGKKPRLFRPPFGVTNPNLRRMISAANLVPVGWSLRSLDTTIRNRSRLRRRISRVKAGDIVLFHDGVSNIADIVKEFIDICKASGLKIVSLPDATGIPAYE